MATCPNCGLSSRTTPGLMEIKQVMVAAPIESFSLAAVQWKMSVFPAWRLQCRCGWSVVGRIENDEFVADSPGSVLG